MPKFSAFTPFGMLKFSGAPSRGEQIYRSMYAAKAGAFDLTKGGYNEAKVYAQSMGIARGRYALERAFNNQNPFKAVELLPSLEKNWSVIPSETDTLLDRQLNVAAAMMLVRGAMREAILAGLQAILGSHFIALRTFLPGEVTTEQPTGDFGPLFARPELPFKVIRLTGPVALLNTPTTVPYTNADSSAGAILVQKDDVFMVQPENTGLAEVVTIISATAADLTATFKRSHDIDAFATTQNWVNWTSTQRVYLVVVDHAAAIDAETTRRVDDFMSKVSRGVSFWDIVEPTTVGAATVGPFTLDVSPLGMVPLTQIAIVKAPPPDFELLPSTMTTGGGPLKLFGRHLSAVTGVSIDATSVAFTIISDFQINIALPAIFSGASSPYSVTAVAPAGTTVKVDALTLTYAPLTMTSCTPNSVPSAGGTALLVKGTGFLRATDLRIGGFTLATWAIVDDNTISAVSDAAGGPGTTVILVEDSTTATASLPFIFT